MEPCCEPAFNFNGGGYCDWCNPYFCDCASKLFGSLSQLQQPSCAVSPDVATLHHRKGLSGRFFLPVFSSVGCMQKVQEKEADSDRGSGAAARAQQIPVEMQKWQRWPET